MSNSQRLKLPLMESEAERLIIGVNYAVEMDRYPGYKGGGLCYLELDEPLAWLPAEVARLSAPRQGLSYDSFGNAGGFSTHYSPWAEHSQGSLERNLTQITDGDHCYGHSLCPPTDLKKLKEVYTTLLSSMEKKFLKKEARHIQMMLDSGLTMNQQHHSSLWECSGQLFGGPVRSVDVHGVWEDARQALKEFKDHTDVNRPMICMDQGGGLSLKQEMAFDFGRTVKEQYQPPPTTWNTWSDPLQLHTVMNGNGCLGEDCTIVYSQDPRKGKQEDDCVMNMGERVEQNEKQGTGFTMFSDEFSSTSWTHLLYEDKNHGEFKTDAQMLKTNISGTKFCGFCRRNGATLKKFLNHPLRNDVGKLVCPVLRSYTCPNCGATGDAAHTVSYCPSKKQPHNSQPLAVKLKNTMRNASSVRRFNH
ncbi:uncharacterized protein LOC125043483 isoform X1 [Penaeus chinensis]|uniref:uncharacterized protein LOC125043483 isoform X1 n=1 Tax=Penaeus chinensis TaxID=139456 RepID=UPI001FB5EC4A|nr:uncharacterized protein LOC125043483 isoform X1 [Penaeus chinensis]